MLLSPATLAAIQKAGSIVKKLQETIQSEAKKQADKLSKLLSANPFAFANEIEASELQALTALSKIASIIKVAEDALNEAFATGSSAEPTQVASSATSPETAPVAEQAKADAPAKKTLAVVALKESKGGNFGKLFKVLQSTLSATEFGSLNQSEVAKKAGIPIGSMNALVKKLISLGEVLTDSDGGYKLAKAPEAAIVQSATSAGKPKARTNVVKELPSTQNAATKTRVKKAATKVPAVATEPAENASEPSETKEAASSV